MSLVDALMGGVVFAMASAASLHVYGTSLQVAQGYEKRQQLIEQMELALAEGDQRMAEITPGGSCLMAASQLADLLRISSTDGLSRDVLVEGSAVRLVIQAPGLPERSRWYVPAAYGVCVEAP